MHGENVQVAKSGGSYVAIATCPFCRELKMVRIERDVAVAFKRYRQGIGYIQDVPADADMREFLKTGMCLECQSWFFAPMSDEESEVR